MQSLADPIINHFSAWLEGHKMDEFALFSIACDNVTYRKHKDNFINSPALLNKMVTNQSIATIDLLNVTFLLNPKNWRLIKINKYLI